MSRFVPLATLSDPVEAGMLKELLEGEGIRVSAPGLMHRGMLGMVGSFVEIRLEVPEADVERARELLAQVRGALVEGGEEDDDDDEEDDDEEDDDERDDGRDDADRSDRGPDAPPSPRQKRIAAFCAIGLSFGCGHFYARSYRAGIALLALEVACFGFVMSGFPAAILALPVIVLADLFGALVAVDRYNGVPRPDLWAGATLFLPLLALVAVALAPVLLLAAPETLIGEAERAICEAQARCLDRAPEACVERFARRTVELREPLPHTDSCAACIAERGPSCDDLRRCVGPCGGVAQIVPYVPTRDPGDPFGLRRLFAPLDGPALPLPTR